MLYNLKQYNIANQLYFNLKSLYSNFQTNIYKYVHMNTHIITYTAPAAKSLQSCLTLCDQARITGK